MTLKIAMAILGTILIIAFPVAYIIYMKKKKNVRFYFFHVLMGIVTGFLSKDVLFNVLGNIVLMIIPSVGSSTLSYSIFLTVLTALLQVFGLYVLYKFIFKEDMNLSAIAAITIGLVISDAFVNYIMLDISNITYLIQSSNGTLYDNLLESVTSEQAQAVIASYEALPSSYYLYPGILVFVSIASNYLLMILIARDIKNKFLKYIGMILMAGIIYVIISFTTPLVIDFANPILCMFAGILLISAEANSRILVGELNGKRRKSN